MRRAAAFAAVLAVTWACGEGEGEKRPPAVAVGGAVPTPARTGPVVLAPPPYAERVELPSSGPAAADGGLPVSVDALLFRPQGAGPFRAVVALHGCRGLYEPEGRFSPHYDDWAVRLRDLGYAVLMPDSFTARGITDACRHAP